MIGLDLSLSSGRRPNFAPVPLNGGNLTTAPDDFTNAWWTKTGVTVTANQSGAPDGTTTMDAVVPTAANTDHWINSSAVSVLTSVTVDFIVKTNGYNKIMLRENSATGAYASFNVGTVSVIETANVGLFTVSAPAITALANGSYRISAVFTPTVPAAYTFGPWILPASYTTGNAVAWTGDGTSGMFLWHGQIY